MKNLTRPRGRLAGETEARLAELACEGCSDALAELFARSIPMAYPAVGRILADRDDIDEALQDAAVCAVERLSEFDADQAAFPTWFRGIARHKALHHESISSRVAPATPAQIAAIERPDDSHLVEDDYFGARLALPDSVRPLPDLQKRTLFLRHSAGFTHSEIAEILDRSVNAVHQTEHRAMQQLRKRARRGAAGATSARAVQRNPMARRLRLSPVVAARRAFAF